MIILGVDLETTGLNPKKDKIVEIGYVLYDLKNKKSLYSVSKLIKYEELQIDESVVEVHGITEDMANTYGFNYTNVFNEFNLLCKKADYLVAHNSCFEKSFLKEVPNFDNNIKWLDTMYDLPYPKHITTRKLVYLAYEHGMTVESAHRALDDVVTMINIMNKYGYEVIKNYASSPTLTCVAQVDFKNKGLAKKAGFNWDSDKKQWIKLIKENEVEKFRKSLSFNIIVKR